MHNCDCDPLALTTAVNTLAVSIASRLNDADLALGGAALDHLREMIDLAAAQASHPEAQAAAVKRLQGMERKNVETARRLLGL